MGGAQPRRYDHLVRTWFALVLPMLLSTGCGSSNGVGSVGAVFGRDSDTRALYVREAPPGLPAEDAGLLPGDQVVMIEGLYVRDLSERDIRAKLRGEIGSTLSLTILRGNDVRHVRVTRSAIRERGGISPREQKIAE